MKLPKPNSLYHSLHNERGNYFTFSAVALVVIIGFAALGIEIGRWYAIQGEMGKAIDGAAFAGALNVNNPEILETVGLETFVTHVAEANFPDGLLGTTTPTFTMSNDGNGRITVDGSTTSINTLARAYDTKLGDTNMASTGSAKLRLAEIAMVLDVSGSMSSAIGDLRDSSTTFVENFEDQEADNKFALITFASGVQLRYDLDHNYLNPITSEISGLFAQGWTNSEDGLAQANNLPWSDQSGLPINEKAMQAVIFFSDGNPTAFRGDFIHKDNSYDGVAAGGGQVSSSLFKPGPQSSTWGGVKNVKRTGDGKPYGSSACDGPAASMPTSQRDTVKWEIFSDPTYGLDSFGPTNGLDPEECYIGQGLLKQYHEYVIRKMAIDNAQALKDRGIVVYTIGLGNVDQDFLLALSSGPKYAFYTPDSSELEGIFQTIANLLKLVLTS